MGSSHFSVELTDRIIDFCHNDKRLLSNCALTHSSWLAASRFHLFHTIPTTGAYETTKVAQLESIIHETPSTLSYRHSSIIPYIRIVKIESLVEYYREVRHENATLLAHTIRQFCNRERLPPPSVHTTLSLSLGHSDGLWSFSPIGDMVTHVKLSDVTFRYPGDIWPSLSIFPLLQYLELENVGFDPAELASVGVAAEGTFNCVPLSTIRTTTLSMGFVISSLVAVAGSLSRLDDFGITYQDVRQEALPQLARAIQGGVKCLRFSATCYPGDERVREWRPSASDIRIPEFVGRFRSLETLVLDNLLVDGSDQYYGFDMSFGWIVGVLQQLSSQIQKLVLEVTATGCSQLDMIPWASIDSTVHPDTRQFKALVRVEVLVKWGGISSGRPPSIDKDLVCSEIARRLPRLNLLGLLRCDTVGF